MKAAAVLDPIAMPPSIDEHKSVIRHAQQLRELQDKLTRAQTHRADVVAEQRRLRSAQHEADVAIALGDGPGVQPDPDRAPRLAQLDAEVIRAGTEEATLTDALERLTTIAAQERQQVQQEINEQIRAAARAQVRRMIPLVQEVAALNQQLIPLAERASGLTLPHPSLLNMWLEQAHHMAGDR